MDLEQKISTVWAYVTQPNVLIAMNLPSLDKFESTVVPGGMIFADSTLIERKVARDDVKVFYIPATQLASDNGTPTLANMIIVGKVLKEIGEYDEEKITNALKKVWLNIIMTFAIMLIFLFYIFTAERISSNCAY